jgi:hypothetical protein
MDWKQQVAVLAVVADLLLRGICAEAQFLTPERVDWQTVREAQPDGLSLALTLNKTSFHQGEIIAATLTFANASTDPYHLWTGGDRSGRTQDIAFYALDGSGHVVPDPLRWYFQRGFFGGGLGGDQDLGEWSITLPANQWLRFEQPGAYTLLAYSVRVQPGNYSSESPSGEDRVELVSDPVTITITRLPARRERKLIRDAQAAITGTGRDAAAAAATLRYLGTPASREALIPHVGTSHSFDARMGLCAAPDPAAEALKVLQAVRDGTLLLDHEVPTTYATLKTADYRFPFPPPAGGYPEGLVEQYRREYEAAISEITDAAIAGAEGRGPAYHIALMTTLFRDSVNRAEIRDKLVQRQLEIMPEQVDTLLRYWSDFGGEDFLPMVRKAVSEPYFNPTALAVLAELRPDEARPLIIEDLQRETPRYLTQHGGSREAPAPLLSLPIQPIPELDPHFRAQLAKEHPPRLDLLMEAIDRYGTPAVLPDLVRFCTGRQRSWNCRAQFAALRFWLRCDPASGSDALKRALATRDVGSCHISLLEEVLLEEWHDAALPVVAAALDDSHPSVVASAIKVLEFRAASTYLAPSLAALQRLEDTNAKEFLSWRHSISGSAQLLLQSSRWTPDADQRRQLERIAAAAGR